LAHHCGLSVTFRALPGMVAGATISGMSPHAEGALLVIGAILGWISSWWWHPLMRCRTCKGQQRNYGGIFRRNWNFCATCGGTGRAPRPGYKFLRAIGVLKHPAEETGPGWARKRRRAARQR
jgi:hypothetical protein